MQVSLNDNFFVRKNMGEGSMKNILNDGVALHIRDEGPKDGPVVMLANSLGTDLRVWDPMLAHMSDHLRVVRFDKRGHGLSDCPAAPYRIESLVSDAERVADALELRGVTFVGLSIGGLIGQGLAHKRPDVVKALVLMDTAAKIGDASMWQDRISALQDGGLASMSATILERWFAASFCKKPELAIWRAMLERTPLEGYIGCCHAIAGADFTESTANLSQPGLAIGGDEDGSTPPDLVKATADLMGAEFALITDAGHLPCVEKPAETAALITTFMERNAL
jgi:3-oxoadipate enol-lactonase